MKNDQKPTFKVQVIKNGFTDDENQQQFANNDKIKNLTFIDGNAIENKNLNSSSVKFNWNENEAYLDDIRMQISKELPNIDRDELEKIVKQFQSQDVINVTTFSPTLSHNLDGEKRMKNELNSFRNNSQTYRGRKFRKVIKKAIKKKEDEKARQQKITSRTDFNAEQSIPDQIAIENNDYENENKNLKFESENLKSNEDCNKEEEKLNSKILNQINNLLEQQFNSLKNELKANKSLSKQEEEKSLLNKLAPELNLESHQIKSKTSYIPENKYKIEKVNGVKRVIQKPFINNILNQKKFNSVFANYSPIKIDDSFRIDESARTGESAIINQMFRKKKNKLSDKDESGKLNIGDYGDSLY